MMEMNNLLKAKREAYYEIQKLKELVTSEDRLFSKEEDALYKTFVDKMNETQRSIEILESMNDLNSKMKENVYDARGTIVGTREEESIKYQEIVNKWMRNGNEGLTAEERQILSPKISKDYKSPMIEIRGTGLTAGGAELQATDLMSGIISAKKYFGGWLSAGDEFTTAQGNPLTFPTVDDTAYTGALEAAGTDAFDSSDAVTFTSSDMSAYIMSSQGTAVANNWLDDASMDMGRIVGEVLGTRLWRAISTYATSGTGSSQPSGIASTTGTVGAPLGVLAGSGTYTRARLLQLMGKVDYSYHQMPGAAFMMHSSSMYELAGIPTASTDGRPLWQPSMVAGVPDKIEGFPFWINNDLTAATVTTAGSRHILFGDMKSFKIRYAGPTMLVRLNELYAAKLQTGFIALQRVDTKLIKPNLTTYAPIKYLRKLST